MDISFIHWLPVLGIFAGGAALGDLLGFGAAAAADIAPEAAIAAEAAPEVITAGADIAPFASGADVLAAGGADVLGLGGLGDAAALGAGVDALGFGVPAAADAAVAGVAPAAADLAAVPPAAGAAVESAGGVLPASSALPLPGTALDVTDVSGAGLGGLTNTGQQVASLTNPAVTTDVPVQDLGYTGLDPATRLADAANAVPPSTGGDAAGVDLTAASDSSAIGGGGGVTTPAPGSIPPTAEASQADIGGGMLGRSGVPTDAMGQVGGGTTPGLGGGAGAPKTPPGGGGGGGGFDMWKAAGLGLAAAPLAITLARGQQEMPQQGLQSQGLATAEGAAGQQLLAQAMQGQVTPGQQAQLTLDRQRMINQARQSLFNQGITNPEGSSAWGGMMANIDQQMAVELQQFLTANINEAFSGTGQAQQNLTNLAAQQISLDNAYTNAIANAGRGLGSVIGQAGTRLL